MSNLKTLILMIGLLSLISCGNQQSQQDILAAQQKVDDLLKENSRLQERLSDSEDHKGDLVHYIFLNVKDDVSVNQYQFLVKEIKTLAMVAVVKDLGIGLHENMDDDRALKNRDINFEMRFKNKKDYYKYQKSKEHMRLRELLSPFLAEPPLTYNYIVQ